jgi:hypothetical protein
LRLALYANPTIATADIPLHCLALKGHVIPMTGTT